MLQNSAFVSENIKWNFMTTLIRQFIYILFGFLTISCLAQDKLTDEFHLKYRNKTKTIHSKQQIMIHTNCRWDIDSIQSDIDPQPDTAFCFLNDTFIVRPQFIFNIKYVPNENIKSTAPNYPLNSTYVIKLPISAIDKITVKRQYITIPTFILGYAALTSAVLVAPIVSIDKTFNVNRYKKVAGYSLAIATTMLTVNLAFGTKTYHIKKHKNKNTWKLK